MSSPPLREVSLLLCACVLVSGCGGGGTVASSASGGGGTATQPSSVATVSTLVLSPNPAAAGASVTLLASVTAATGTPSGTVTFYDGTTALGSATLANGTAALSTSTLAAGASHALSFSYAGATGFSASTSAVQTEVINRASAPAAITAHASFDFTTANQTIAGFGGAEAFYVSYLNAHPYAAEINKALFDPQQGLGLTFLRVQNLYYQFTGSNANTFDSDTPAMVRAANAAHGTPLTLLMSSWSPPASIKSNGAINNGETLAMVNGAYDYADFASFWYNSLSAYAALGVSPAYISIQNEPDFTATYASCRFNPTEAPVYGTSYASYGLAFDAVYRKLRTLAAPPKMVGPETFSVGNVVSMASQIPSGEVSAYAHHLYNVNANAALNGPDAGVGAEASLAAALPSQAKWETEYYMYPGFNNAWDIHNALTVANDSVYMYWGLAWPSTFANGQADDQQGVIYLDNPYNAPSTWATPHGWSFNDSYFALKHYSFFVRPGYIRYNATVDNTDERVSVFRSADAKTTVIVVLNTSPTATDGFSLSLANLPYTISAVYRSSFQTPVATGERWANLGAYASSGLLLPPQSVATIVLSN